MGKMLIPRMNDRQKSMFRHLNIELTESIAEEDFLKTITVFLDTHNVLSLATCIDNEPRSTSLEYFSNGLTVYIYSEGGGKFANLKTNPKVCYTIHDSYEPGEDIFSASGIQVWGKASVFKKHDNPEKAGEIERYCRNIEGIKKQGLYEGWKQFNYNIITIEPEKIKYLSMRKGFRNVVWSKEG